MSNMHLSELHWLRPWWLLALLPLLLLFWQLLRRHTRQSRWESVIDPDLLPALLQGTQQAPSRWIAGIAAGWLLAVLALAGPSWQQQDQNTLKQTDGLVILLDLSPSMLITDVQPSRLLAARYKILDLLKQRREGYTGLIAYSGSAHVVSPLSDDSNTIAALVPTLTPAIMPSLGSQVEDAVSAAVTLLHNSGFRRGRILLVSDGVDDSAMPAIDKALQGESIELHVIGVGTAAGGPIPIGNGNFVRNGNGTLVTVPFNDSNLQTLASQHNGHYSSLRIDDTDIATVAAPPAWLAAPGAEAQDANPQRDSGHTLPQWQDSGYWLTLPCLLFALLAFRRGLVLKPLAIALPLLVLTLAHSGDTLAVTLPGNPDWWQTRDQQAAIALQQGDATRAAQLFRDPQWKAYAEYQANDHQSAAEHFASSNTAAAHYNQGNALAKTGQLDEAIKAYDEALKQQPSLADARFNRDLVDRLRKQQQEKQNSKQQQQQQQQKQDSASQSGSQNQDNRKNPSSGEQDSKQQKNTDQQPTDKQQPSAPSQKNAQAERETTAGSDDKNPEENKAENKQTEYRKTEDKQTENKQTADNPAEDRQPQQQQQQQQQALQDSPASGKDRQQPDDKTARMTAEQRSAVDDEKKQAAEQMLRKVPDDPGGLLRNKFSYYYQKSRMQGDNRNKEQRW